MLILPPGHASAVLSPRRLGRRERWMVGSVLGVVLVVAVVIVISIAGGGKTVPRGCVDVTISGPIGGEELYRCGEEAVSLCASVGKANGFTGDPGRDVARACRKTGLPVG